MPSVVLSVGKDGPLLHSRSAVLRAAGYMVTEETSFRRAVVAFDAGDYDAVLLCHSLDAKSVARFAEAIHKRSPSTPVVQVAANWSSETRSEVVPIESEPHTMLASLHELIEQTVSPSHRTAKPSGKNSEGSNV